MINEKILKPFLNLLSNEQVGRIIKKLILENDCQEVLNDIETALLTSLKEKQTNYKAAALKRWQKRKAEQTQKEQKEQKEDLPKRDLQQTNLKKSIYNNYKQFPNIQQTQKDFIKDYQKRGVLTI